LIGNLPDFKLESWFSRWESHTRHQFTASDLETMTVSELLDLAGMPLEALAATDLGYRSPFGTEQFRQAAARTYESAAEDDVLSFAGAQEALFWVMAELLCEGGHAVITVPNYQSLESVPVSTGAQVSGLPLWRGEGAELEWTLDLDRLASMLRPDTRMVAVNFPNNPTGFVPDRKTFEELATLCDSRGIALVSDEVYRGVELDPERTLPQAADLSDRAISINVMSKSYGLPGLRVGWAASKDRDLLSRLERRKHYTSICNPGLSELLAAIGLDHGEQIHDRNRNIVRQNVEIVRDFFDEFPDLLEFDAPVGGCVSYPRYLGPEGTEEFVIRAIEDAGVMMLPASLYTSALCETPSDRFRIGIGRTSVPAAVDALREHLIDRGL
jgi:aspartate/methionine/tyrosine aminotransferase